MGKTIVVTGASDGIGAAAANRLVADGHHVVIVGRSPEKTRAVANRLGVESLVADFAQLDDVRRLADELLARCPRIDVLANNAGGINGPTRAVTQDGHELTMQVNYLAPFLLNHLLRDRLLASRATVIHTSSMAHWSARLDLNDLEQTRRYTAMGAYANSKAALLLHTRELQRRFGRDGLAAVAFHPGVVPTNFAHDASPIMSFAYTSPVRLVMPTTPAGGADTLVFLAEGTPGVDFPGGRYLIRRREARTRAFTADPNTADLLWRKTERALGLAAE